MKLKYIITLLFIMIQSIGFGQIQKSHRLTIIIKSDNYYPEHRLWNKMLIEQSGIKRFENILPDQDKYIIQNLEPGRCRVSFCSVFGEVIDTTVIFDKQAGLTLICELPDYRANQIPIDSLLFSLLKQKDTIYIFFNCYNSFFGHTQGLITVIVDGQNFQALLDDKIYENESKIIQSNIKLEDISNIVSFENRLKYWDGAPLECTTVKYYTLYKDGKVRFGRDGTCSENGIESLKEILFETK